MKMAKASNADMEMALTLCGSLEAIDRGWLPAAIDGAQEDLDLDDVDQCGVVLRHLAEVLKGGSIGRVIWGMYVLVDPANKLLDPDARTLEPHPDAVANARDAVRYRELRRGQKWSVVDGIGDILRGDALDHAIDAATVPAGAEQGAK